MGKQCKGACKRTVNEYYLFEGGHILCYDCWKRGLDQGQQFWQEYEQLHRKFNEIEKQMKQLSHEREMNTIYDYDEEYRGGYTITGYKDPMKKENIDQIWQRLWDEREIIQRNPVFRSSLSERPPHPQLFLQAKHIKE